MRTQLKVPHPAGEYNRPGNDPAVPIKPSRNEVECVIARLEGDFVPKPSVLEKESAARRDPYSYD